MIALTCRGLDEVDQPELHPILAQGVQGGDTLVLVVEDDNNG